MAHGPSHGSQGDGSKEAIDILERIADQVSLAAHELQSFEKQAR